MNINMKQTVTACASMLLLCSAAAHAEVVTCDNENTDVPASTPTANFELHADGTATDTTTGLVWMRCALEQEWDESEGDCTGEENTHTWREALQAAQDINSGGGFAGHTDWRLPNKNELESIVEQRCWSPAINAAVFPRTPDGWFWSSSPYADRSGNAWGVSFGGGGVNWYGTVNDFRVRLVRTGQ